MVLIIVTEISDSNKNVLRFAATCIKDGTLRNILGNLDQMDHREAIRTRLVRGVVSADESVNG